MNLTARAGVSLWNVKKTNNVFEASVMLGEYKNLRTPARKSRMRLRVQKRHGLPFALAKLKPRLGLIIGAVGFIAVIQVMSLFVWTVDVEGNVEIKSEEVLSVMSSLGLESGTLKRKIDIPMLEQNAMIKMTNVAWLSVNIKGSQATVSLKERITPPTILPKETPCNIKARCDGQIMRMEIYSGTPIVNNGDAVVKGQLLVSGIVEDAFGGSTIHHAEAKINAYTKRSMQEEIPLNQVIYAPTGRKVSRYSANLFGLHLPLTLVPNPGKNYKRELHKDDVMIGTSKLPITLYTEQFTEQTGREVALTEQEAKLQAQENIKRREEEEMKDVKILEREEKGAMKGDSYLLSVVYYGIEDIAVEEALEIK